jgi:hypothetical protein
MVRLDKSKERNLSIISWNQERFLDVYTSYKQAVQGPELPKGTCKVRVSEIFHTFTVV